MMNKTVEEIKAMGFEFEGRVDECGFDDENGQYEMYVAYWGDTVVVKDGVVVEEN